MEDDDGRDRMNADELSAIQLDELDKTVVVNRCYMDFLGQLTRRIDSLLAGNRREQALLKRKIHSVEDLENDNEVNRKSASPAMFFPPYFKDTSGMVPQRNEEERLRITNRECDVMVAEEIRWTDADLRLLRRSVKNSLIQVRILPFVARRDLYREKLYDGYGKATEVDIKHWEQVVASMNRRIAYVKQLDDEFILKGDYNEVDWLAMANISFRNTRTARQLRLKWLNEQCPEWSKDEWSYAEIEHLKKYAEDSTRIKAVNWEIVADELDTDRTPLQCFARVQEMKQYMLDRCSWTKEEDLKLRTMKIIAQNLGAVRWGRVAWLMGDRSLDSCHKRFTYALDDRHKRGVWSRREKSALKYAVREFGTYDWLKISKFIGTRNAAQCRSRHMQNIWVYPWKPEEDRILMAAVKRFGQANWSRIAALLPGRSRVLCRSRFRTLCASTIEAKLYKVDVDEVIDEETLKGDTETVLSQMSEEKRILLEEAISRVIEKTALLNQSFSQLIHGDVKIKEGHLSDEALRILKRHYDKALRSALDLKPLRLTALKILRHNECKSITEAYECLNDDQSRKRFLEDALISLIKRADEQRLRTEHIRLRKTPVINICHRFMTQALMSDVLNAMESCQSLSPLPPFLASLELFETLKEGMNFLNCKVKKLFNCVRMGDSEEGVVLDIADETKKDPSYQYCSVQLRRLLFMPMLMNRSIEKEYLRLNRMKLREIVEREIADDNNSSKNREKISATQLEVEDEGTKNNFEMGDFVKMMRDRLQLLEKKQVQKSGTRRTNATKRCAQPPKTKAKRRRKEATPESTSESGSDFISDVEMESSGSESESESEEEDGEVVCVESDLLDGSIESDSSDHDDEQREERFDSSADETSHPMHDKRS